MLVYPMLAMIEFKYTHKVCTIIKLLRLLANKLRRAWRQIYFGTAGRNIYPASGPVRPVNC